MIKDRQQQLDGLLAELLGGISEEEETSEPASDLILKPDAYPPKGKIEMLLENEEFLGLWEKRGNLPSLSEYDMSLANFAADDGWSDQEIADLIIAFRREHGQTKKDREKALRPDYIQRTLTKVRNRGKNTKHLTVASRLIKMAKDMELFHTPDKRPYAAVSHDGRIETVALSSQVIKEYLSRLYYEETGSIPNSQAIQDALNALRGDALFRGQEKPVYARIAESSGKIYLDLCDPDCNVVEITATGWSVIRSSPVYFVRKSGMVSLPMPQTKGDIGLLRGFLNVTSDGWILLLAWLISAFMPGGPYVVLIITGEHGSAKSTVAKMLRLLIDPYTVLLRSLPREERDLAIAASNSWIIAFDNVSYLPSSLSDAICRLSTGAGFGTRELRTDNEEVLFTAKRPVMLNGIGDIATKSDLLSRAIIISLPPIPNDKRRTENDIWKEFEVVHPKILASLLDAVSLALRDSGTVKLDSMPRMADFARWVAAGIPALGINPGDFLEAYEGNAKDIDHLALESTPVAKEIMILAANTRGDAGWEGTASELLEELNLKADESLQRGRDWPKSHRALGAALGRLAPNFRAVGINIERYRKGGEHGERLIRIKKVAQGHVAITKRRERCVVTKLADGGCRIQLQM